MSKTVTSRFVLRGDNRLNSAFSKAQVQLANLGRRAALFSAAAVAGGVAVVRAQSKQIDALAKTSDALGITTENLQSLHAMAELSGVGADDLDKRLGKLQKNLGEIARRGGTMAEALTDAGMVIEDVIALPADQQFEAVAKALSKLQNQTLRTSIASDLFGRDANRLLKLTDQLANEGLEDMRAKLEAMGVLITRSEAAGVERMNDSVLMAQKVFGGLAQKFTTSLAPAIAAVAEEFLDSAENSDDFSKKATKTAEKVARGMYFIMDVVDSVGRTFDIASKVGIIAFETLKGTLVSTAEAIINGPTRATNELIKLLNRLPGIDIDYRFSELAPGLKDDLRISESIIAQAFADIDAILLKPLPSTGLEARLARIRQEIANVKQDIRSGDFAEGGFLEEIDISKIPKMSDPKWVEKYKRETDKMTEFTVQAARNMQTAFADFLFDPLDQGFKGLVRGFAKTLQRMAAEAAASAIFNWIFSSMSGSSNSWIAGLGKAFTSRDSGGPGATNTPYLIGTGAQPELFVPKTPGHFIPNFDRLATAGAGGANNVVVNVDARENKDPAALMALVPLIQAQIEASIMQKQRRGF